MRDVTNADIALGRCDDLARLHAAAALDQLAVQPGLLEIADPVGDELCLIDRHSDGIDHTAASIRAPRATGCHRDTATCNNRQRRASGDMDHQARSFSFPATLSSALNMASPISAVESFLAPASAMSAVLAPDASAVATAFSSKSASSGRLRVRRSIIATLRIEPSGLAIPLPAISGALPWTGS